MAGPLDLNALPVKVLYEHYVCSNETPQRCRKRSMFYMDGQGYCLDHVYKVPESLYPFLKHIIYKV